MGKLYLLCLGLCYFVILAQHAVKAETPSRLIYESEPTAKHNFDTKFLGNALLPLESAEELYAISYRLRIEADEQNSKAESVQKQFNRRANGRRLAKELRERRELDLAHQQQHQASVRKLEDLDYSLVYEYKRDGLENAPIQTPETNYLRNSLADRVLVPVIEIWRFECLPHLPYSEEDRKWYFEKSDFEKHPHTLELLKPFTQLRLVDLSSSKLALDDLKQLQDFPELEIIILPENLLVPETRKQIQHMLPRCELKSEKESKYTLDVGSLFY